MLDAAPSTTLVEIKTIITITLLPSWAAIITFTHEICQYVILNILSFIPCSSVCCQKDDEDPGINKCVVLGDCQPMAIVSTTTFVTTNASIAAPYLGISNCISGNLTIKVYVLTFAHFNFVNLTVTHRSHLAQTQRSL